MNTLKKENETHFEYVKRLTENRKDYNLSYSKWGELITNGATYSDDNCRKFYYLVVPLLEALDEDRENQVLQGAQDCPQSLEDLIFELEQKKLDLQKERVKIQTLKSELNKAVREESRKELFYEQLLEEVRKCPLPVKEFQPFTENSVKSDENKQTTVEHCHTKSVISHKKTEFVQLFGDIHYGATFDINYNAYSPEICQQRFEKLVTETFRIAEKEGFNELVIVNCGDSLQGVLRISDLSLNSITVVQQVVGIARLIANYLNELSTRLTIKYIHTVQANHSELRFLNTGRGELAEDVESLIGEWISDLLINNPRVEVIVAKDTVHNETICGYEVGFLHGQEVKNFETFVRDISFHHKRNYSYLVMGHIHHMKSVTVGMGETGETVQIISTPSMVGSCQYSNKLLKSSPAGALLLGFEEGRGKTLTYEITL